MNDSSPLKVDDCEAARWPRRYQRVDVVLGQNGADEVDGDPRLAAVLSEAEADSTSLEQTLGGGSEDFLRVWPNAGTREERKDASALARAFSMSALQGAVIANGAALVALALVMAGPDNGPKTGLMASAIVLGLGLVFAALSVVVMSLDFRSAQLRIARVATSTRLATISGAVSYAALILAALPLI